MVPRPRYRQDPTAPLAKYVRRLRESKGWSVEDLARETGLTMATVQNIESGRTARPNVKTLSVLSNALPTTVGDLVGYIWVRRVPPPCSHCGGTGREPEG